MAETREQVKARLEAELAKLDQEGQEEDINRAAADTSLYDVVSHLVSNASGYPTHADREAHARAVRRHFKVGEYADTETPAAPAEA